MTDSPPPVSQFYAMPDCPHLIHSVCGYTLLALEGISSHLTSDLIERIIINGITHKFRPMGDTAVMLIPAIRQEAQTVKVYLKQVSTLETLKPFKPYQATATPAPPVYGFTAPFTHSKRHL